MIPNKKKYSVFAGAKSQTGIAAKDRCPEIEDELIDDVNWLELIRRQKEDSDFDGFFPIWNSNQGYIKKVELDKTIFEYEIASKIKIIDMWPQPILFYASYYENIQNKEKSVISVIVARLQCSHWLEQEGKIGNFQGEESTKIAVEKYLENPGEYHTVLCTKDQVDAYNLKILKSDVQNKINYTTFVRSTKGKNNGNSKPEKFALFSLTLPTSVENTSAALANLIDELVNESNSLEFIPKISFVINLGEDKDGILVEVDNSQMNQYETLFSTLDDIESESNIEFIGTVGTLEKSFISEVFQSQYVHLPKNELFIKYIAPDAPDDKIPNEKRAVFYAIPGFNLFVHGYGESIISSVVSRYLQAIYLKIESGKFSTSNKLQKNTFIAIKGQLDKNRDFSSIDFFQI
ncbi:hypothetical protein LFX15_03805 [Leptospira levettii]|uniref:prephenate dehydratase domain-containing protein n=1 Tax=Leptospira levettii TaxID=2023178 RepID=UPI001EEC0A28|nr:prephenate dehydratase domain-containing protein [Leptospira levettii]MCG6147402.1 hypothetical protein [Leptospira levettii]